MTTLDAAQEYVSRGWQPIPVPHRSKKPALKGWPDLRLTAADLARHFNGQPSNLGILLGEPSGGLVDADLDCARWLANGLDEPKAVMQATAAYRKSQEPLTDFVADCCVLGPRYRVSATRLREVYDAWCKSEGLKYPLAGRAWGAALRALGCTDGRLGGGARCWDGIDIRIGDPGTPDERQPGEDDPPPFGDRP